MKYFHSFIWVVMEILGHRRLQGHGVLHKGITPYRILIQPDAQEGDRGVLLDYASGWIDSSSPRTRATVSYEGGTGLSLY